MSFFFSRISRPLRVRSLSNDHLAHKTSDARPLKPSTVRRYDVVQATEASRMEDSELRITPEVVTAGKSLAEVLRGWTVFKLFDFKFIVDHSVKLYKLSKILLGQNLTNKLLRSSIFGQFAGGVNEEDTKSTVQRLANVGISSIWFYCCEQDLDEMPIPQTSEELVQQEGQLQRNFERKLNCITMSDDCNHDGVARFAALKLTGFINPNLLRRLNTMVLASERAFLTLSAASPAAVITDRRISMETLKEKLPQVVKLLETTEDVDIIKWNRVFRLPENVSNFQYLKKVSEEGVESISDLEHEQLENFTNRLKDIGECASASNVCVLIDAEQSYFQPAIDSMVVHYLQTRYNRHRPTIYNTLQTYLTRSYSNTLMHLATARDEGFKSAIKLVRGCYFELENGLSKTHGYTSPVNPSKADTDASYHKSLDHILVDIAQGGDNYIMVASHNLNTVFHAVKMTKKLNLSPSDGRVVFGQILGMADHLTYPLAQAGYSVHKVVSFGSVDDVMPFLSRRAQENRGMMENAQEERRLYFEEIKRRVLG